MKLLRRRFLHLAAGAAVLPAVSRHARAETYPTRPLRLIVGFPPGGGADIVARIMAKWLTERLGYTVIIENKPGAATNIATQAVVNAPADGYTLLFISTSSATNATFYDTLPFNFLRDIVPVGGLVRVPFIMEVTPAVPARTVADFIAYAKANPGKINMASTGVGTSVQLSGELFKVMTAIDMTHVPYRGASPALTDLISGQVQVLFGDMPSSLAHVQSGALRPLAVTTATRSGLLPQVPTVAETVAGYEASSWYGIGAPRDTPPDIVEKLNREINAGLTNPVVTAQLTEAGTTPMPFTPAAFRTHIAAETEKWGKVIKLSGAKPD